MIYDNIEIRNNLKEVYADVLTPEVLSAISALSHFNKIIKEVMTARINRRAERFQHKKRITFLDPESYISRTDIKVQDARNGKFEGAVIPKDLERQMDTRHRSCGKTKCASRNEYPQRCLCIAFWCRWLDV